MPESIERTATNNPQNHMKNVRLENQGYMGMTSTRSPMFLEAQPLHDGHPIVSSRLGNAERELPHAHIPAISLTVRHRTLPTQTPIRVRHRQSSSIDPATSTGS